jgi:cellulose synthase/poly-beta-1,6-N-acetylglucosamine synthase-like glycosyltransferase
VTVLVAARDEADRIQETLSYVARQDYPGPIEVLVVDNGSTDGTRALLEAGGWPDAIGEDIVLTWKLMRQGARVHYEPSAVAFTAAPNRLVHLQPARPPDPAQHLGFPGFVLTYQMLMSPIAVIGYGQELLGLRRRWK